MNDKKSGAIVWIVLVMLGLWAVGFWYWPRTAAAIAVVMIVGAVVVSNLATGRARHGRF